MNFSIIYNPIATNFSQAALDHLIFKFVDRGFTLNKIAKSEFAGHTIELINRLDPVSDYLFTLGGDGTVNEAFRAFNNIEQRSVYGHISVGTTNDMANNFNLYRHNPVKSVDKLAHEGKETFVDSLMVNGECVSYVSSFGFVAPIPYLVKPKFKKKFGHAAYVLAALPVLCKIPQKVKATYTANGETKSIEIIMALITNSKGTGGIDMYKNVDRNDGKFEVFLLKSIKPSLMLRALGEYFRDSVDISQYTECADIFSTDKLDIRFDGVLPEYDLDNDGERAGFKLTLHENELHYKCGKKIRTLSC